MTFYEKVQKLCENQGFAISSIVGKIPNLQIRKSSLTGWKNGAKPRPDKVKAIADYFGVSPSYLTDEDAETPQNIFDTHSIIGQTHAPVSFINGLERKLSVQEVELLNIYEKLNIMDQAKLVVYAGELMKAEE